ncbi:MAG: flagellar biosynthetic protein FliO [Phycisphaerales bacterium]
MPSQEGDMARRTVDISVIGIVALCAAAHAQVGPPMGESWSAPASVQTPQVEPGAQAQPQPPTAQTQPVRAAERRELPAESSMPLMAPAESATPEGSSGAATGSGWARSLASVALVLGLILVLAAAIRFLSRRSGAVAAMIGPGGRAPSGVLEVLARYPVGRGQVFVLLRIDRRILLLSQTMAGKSAGFTTLAQFDEPDEVAAILRQTRDEASESISSRFRQAMERFQASEGDGVERGEIIEVGPRGEPVGESRGLFA